MTTEKADGVPIRWGIIGCGAVTEVKSGPAYQKTRGFELTAVMRRNLALAQDYANRHNVAHALSDADKLINDNNIDAIYIATPPDSHKYYALLTAQAGKICCIEKPIAPSYQDALIIQKTFEAAKLPLFVAYYRRSLPRFNKVKSLLESGEIGEIRHINWHLSKPANELDLTHANNWRTNKDIALGGYFDDLASHGLDLFSYLLGDYQQAKGIGLNQQGLYSSFDAISACWQHKSGITGSGSWNFGGYSRQDKVTIYGSKGEMCFSIFDEEPISVENGQGKQSHFIENPENIQLYHVSNMQKQLVENIAHPSNGATALHTSWVMDEILKKV
jgi:predicted dehydrogenase